MDYSKEAIKQIQCTRGYLKQNCGNLRLQMAVLTVMVAIPFNFIVVSMVYTGSAAGKQWLPKLDETIHHNCCLD